MWCFIFHVVLLLGIITASPNVDRIVGGTPAKIQQFPYQISLQLDNKHICGGSIIHYSYILTAAHCVFETPAKSLSIRAGSESNKAGGVKIKVCSVYVHEQYNPDTEDSDIAILKLCKVLPFSNSILPVALPNYKEKTATNAYGVVSGWGYLREDGEEPELLQQVRVPTISTTKCKKLYLNEAELTKNMFCAGAINGGKDSCQGDSGGPFLINGKLFGVVSWGKGCGLANFPGVYTKVSEFRQWIKKITNN